MGTGLGDRLELAWATRPARGEYRCGDLAVIVDEGERLLVALIDGLGHGLEAARAAEAAGAFIRAHALLPLDELFHRCSAALADTRGVAMTVVRFHAEPFGFEHAGVGNVALVSASPERLEARPYPGVVGKSLRKVVVTRHRLYAGDLLLLHSDGISSRLEILQLRQKSSAQKTVDAVMEAHAKDHDDASCVVAECR